MKEFLQGHPGALKLLLGNRENIICRNRSTGRVKVMQLRALYEHNRHFWDHQERWEYYLDRTTAFETRERLQQLRDEAAARRADGAGAQDGAGSPSPGDAPESNEGTG